MAGPGQYLSFMAKPKFLGVQIFAWRARHLRNPPGWPMLRFSPHIFTPAELRTDQAVRRRAQLCYYSVLLMILYIRGPLPFSHLSSIMANRQRSLTRFTSKKLDITVKGKTKDPCQWFGPYLADTKGFNPTTTVEFLLFGMVIRPNDWLSTSSSKHAVAPLPCFSKTHSSGPYSQRRQRPPVPPAACSDRPMNGP